MLVGQLASVRDKLRKEVDEGYSLEGVASLPLSSVLSVELRTLLTLSLVSLAVMSE